MSGHLMRRLMELYGDRKKHMYMVFIDLEKAYSRVLRKILWRCLGKKDVSTTYIRVVKDMYEGVRTRVRTLGRDTNDFPHRYKAPLRINIEPFSSYYGYG